MIKAIIFASNVFGNSKESYKLFAKEFSLKEEDLKRINKKYFLPAKKGKYSKKELIDKLSKELNTTKKHFLENARDCGNLLKTNKQIMSLVKKLKKNYKLISVSNTNELFASLKIEKKQYSSFHLSILSYKIKSLRPEMKTYREILLRLKLKGEECLYIDSKEKMLVPARKLEMKAILYKNNSQLLRDLKKNGIKF